MFKNNVKAYVKKYCCKYFCTSIGIYFYSSGNILREAYSDKLGHENMELNGKKDTGKSNGS